MPAALTLAAFIAWLAVRRAALQWVGRQWIDERIGILTAVLILILTSGIGLGAVILTASALLHPTFDYLVVVLILAFIVAIDVGIGMTVITYASTQGVREHLRAQRARAREASTKRMDLE